MEAKELILRSLEQSQGYVTKTLDGLTQEKVAWSPTAECDSIAFTLWHTVRVEDTFVHRVVQHGKELYETIPYRKRDDEAEMQKYVDPNWKRVLPRWQSILLS